MNHRSLKTSLLSAALLGLLGGAVVVDNVAQAQSSRSERGSKKGSQKVEQRYPDSTRVAPEAKNSAKVQKDVSKLISTYNDDKYAEVFPIADAILANDKANEYDKALAAQIAGLAAANSPGEEQKAITYLKKAVDANALENNAHFDSMLQLADLQLRANEEDPTEGLATLEKLITEGKPKDGQIYLLKGQALYQKERYAEAIPALKTALELKPDAPASWNQLLMAAYSEAGQTGDAVKLAEASAAKAPDDVKVQMNLANVYLQADQTPKALAVMEKLYAAGKITEERDYRNLYAMYMGSEGQEKKAIEIINAGMQKGILKPDHQTYNALAQAYYFSEQPNEAIEAYKKAAPLASDGETWLNLARALINEGRVPEAKEAAKQAIAKGVKKPEDAQRIIKAQG